MEIPVPRLIPMASLAGVLVFTVVKLVDMEHLRKLKRERFPQWNKSQFGEESGIRTSTISALCCLFFESRK